MRRETVALPSLTEGRGVAGERAFGGQQKVGSLGFCIGQSSPDGSQVGLDIFSDRNLRTGNTKGGRNTHFSLGKIKIEELYNHAGPEDT